jgi:hypothetical protein
MGGQGTFDMTAAQFAALEDRSPVFLQHGPLTIRLGRIDKSMLDR